MSRKTPTPKTFSVLPIIYARKKSGKPKNRNKTKNNQPKMAKRLKLYLSLNLSKNIRVYYTKQERRTTILMAKNLEFDNEMKNLSMCVYKGNKKYKPKDWIKFDEYESNNGFHGETFYKNDKVVISFRGTDQIYEDLIKEDILKLGTKNLPSQYVDAHNFYLKTKSNFPNKKIVFTGHSLGGSLAQLMGAETGKEAVTFNAYGVGDLIQKDNIKSTNIRNYGNVDDTVFNLNLRNQLGENYIIGYSKDSEYITKSSTGNYLGGRYPKRKHFIEDMGNLEDAVEYKKPEDVNQKVLTGNVSYNINARDVDKKRVITREEIGRMSKDEYDKNENFINQQLNLGNIMSKAQADEKVKTGDLIWVEGYTREDGTKVCGYYRRK